MYIYICIYLLIYVSDNCGLKHTQKWVTKPDTSTICLILKLRLCPVCSCHIVVLGQCGVPVYKSMPYGEIELVTSYLGRRAVENRGALDNIKKERQLLKNELKRRLRVRGRRS